MRASTENTMPTEAKLVPIHTVKEKRGRAVPVCMFGYTGCVHAAVKMTRVSPKASWWPNCGRHHDRDDERPETETREITDEDVALARRLGR
jgi:hypothetical protein